MSAAKPDMLDETIPDDPVEPSPSTEPNIVRIILADSQAIYRVGMRKIFALEDDIRVVAQVITSRTWRQPSRGSQRTWSSSKAA